MPHTRTLQRITIVGAMSLALAGCAAAPRPSHIIIPNDARVAYAQRSTADLLQQSTVRAQTTAAGVLGQTAYVCLNITSDLQHLDKNLQYFENQGQAATLEANVTLSIAPATADALARGAETFPIVLTDDGYWGILCDANLRVI